MSDSTNRQTSSQDPTQGDGSTREKIDNQHQRAEKLGNIDVKTLLLVLTEQMRDAVVHLQALTREVGSIRAHLEEKDAEEALGDLKERLDRISGEEELLRLKSIYDYIEAEGDLKEKG